MKAWILAPALIAAAIVTAPVASSSPDDPAVFRGIGADTCANFAREVRSSNVAEANFYTWAQGFMSGANMVTGVAGDGYRDLDGDINAQKLSIRQYCDAHPSDDFAQAVVALYQSLPHRAYTPK